MPVVLPRPDVPNTHRYGASNGPLSQAGEIHGGATAIVVGEWTTLPYSGDALSHPSDRAPPTWAAMPFPALHPPTDAGEPSLVPVALVLRVPLVLGGARRSR
jgi:hypothetical protein